MNKRGTSRNVLYLALAILAIVGELIFYLFRVNTGYCEWKGMREFFMGSLCLLTFGSILLFVNRPTMGRAYLVATLGIMVSLWLFLSVDDPWLPIRVIRCWG